MRLNLLAGTSSSRSALFISFALHLTALTLYYGVSNNPSTATAATQKATPSSISIRHVVVQPTPAENPIEQQDSSPLPPQTISKQPAKPQALKPQTTPPREQKVKQNTLDPSQSLIQIAKKTRPQKPTLKKPTQIKPNKTLKPVTTPALTEITATPDTEEQRPPTPSSNLAQQQKTQAVTQQEISPESNYYHHLLAAIERNKFYPVKAKKRGQEGEVILEISLSSDGRITDIQVAKSSGFFTLDKAAFRAVKKIKKFKPFPITLTLNATTVQVPMSYRLI